MKKIISMIMLVTICLSLVACGNENDGTTHTTTQTIAQVTTRVTTQASKKPTIESVVEGIKYEFKDPDSVQLTNASISAVSATTESYGVYDEKTEFYIIGTIRAKNSFGGYAEPQAYIIHYKNGRYKIVGEYNDYDWAMQNAFNELGCGPSMRLE